MSEVRLESSHHLPNCFDLSLEARLEIFGQDKVILLLSLMPPVLLLGILREKARLLERVRLGHEQD